MPIAPTYPGVYIEEIPSGVRTITGVATSVAAFIDRFQRGPLNEAVRILSFADFEREFGGLDGQSQASYAIQQFFLNGGREAWVVRVGSGDAANPFSTSTVVLTEDAGGAGSQVVRVTAGRRIRGHAVNDPGAWGDSLRVDVDYDTTLPTSGPLSQIIGSDELFNLIVTETALQGGRRIVVQTETFRNLTMRPNVAINAIEVVNESSKLVQLSRDAGFPAIPAPPFRPAATGTLGNTLPDPPVIPADMSSFEVTVDPGTGPLAPLPTTLDYGGAAPADYASLRPFLEAAIRAADVNNPLLAGATVQLVGNRFRVLAGRTGAGFSSETTLTFPDMAPDTAMQQLRLTVAEGAVVNVQQCALTGGGDGILPTEAALRGTQAAKTGLFALEDVDIFNVLCVPRAADLAAAEMRAFYAAAEAYCEERRAFLIVDIPETIDNLDDIQTWMAQNDTLRHRNAAVYFPRVRIADPLNQNRLRSVAASGTIAGLYAQTDANRGIWKAPAGIEARLCNVQQLAYPLTDRENGVLNPVGINALRNFPVFGNVAWGARTMDGSDQQASEWKYIPVRRLALFLEESLFRGTKFAVFEPNDEPLWSQIRLNVGAFMQNLFRQGAFQGRTPREAYFVKCDTETTTQADINLGIVNIVVGFAPLKPAEFVILRIQQLAGQIPT